MPLKMNFLFLELSHSLSHQSTFLNQKMRSEYESNYQSFWKFCLCSSQMKRVYSFLCISLVITLIVIGTILLWFVLPTIATVLVWFYWPENTDLFDGHMSAGGVITNLIVWSCAQLGLILVLITAGVVVVVLVCLLCELNKRIKGCIDNIREDYKKEMDHMPDPNKPIAQSV